MSNPSKQKGTRAETNVVRYLKAHGIKAKRKALTGSQDQGDLDVETTQGKMVLEVKAGQQTANPNRSQMAEWLRQAEVEGRNAKESSALVVVRYRRKIEDAEVWFSVMDGGRTMMYLDEFAREYGKAKSK